MGGRGIIKEGEKRGRVGMKGERREEVIVDQIDKGDRENGREAIDGRKDKGKGLIGGRVLG